MRKDFDVILRHLDLFGINRGSNSFAEWCTDKLIEDIRDSSKTEQIETLRLLYEIYRDAGGMDDKKLKT